MDLPYRANLNYLLRVLLDEQASVPSFIPFCEDMNKIITDIVK